MFEDFDLKNKNVGGHQTVARIKVIGVGGAGNNAVERMIEEKAMPILERLEMRLAGELPQVKTQGYVWCKEKRQWIDKAVAERYCLECKKKKCEVKEGLNSHMF